MSVRKMRSSARYAQRAMGVLSFYAFGEPAPQGSKRVVPIRGTGRYALTEASNKLTPWRNAVAHAVPAREHPLDGPLAVRMVFTMRAPAYAGTPKARPRKHPCTAPDLSKLVRSTEDAITDAGGWVDDSRVVEYVRLAKVWPHFDAEALPLPGVIVAAVELPCLYDTLTAAFQHAHSAAWQGRDVLASWQ